MLFSSRVYRVLSLKALKIKFMGILYLNLGTLYFDSSPFAVYLKYGSSAILESSPCRSLSFLGPISITILCTSDFALNFALLLSYLKVASIYIDPE